MKNQLVSTMTFLSALAACHHLIHLINDSMPLSCIININLNMQSCRYRKLLMCNYIYSIEGTMNISNVNIYEKLTKCVKTIKNTLF